MYRTVIVPIDPGDYAVSEFVPAQQLADTHGAELVLVGEADDIAHHRRAFDDDTAVSLRPLRAEETPARAVAETATERGVDTTLIVVATHARGRIGYAIGGGSTAEAIVRDSHAHVLLFGPDCSPTWRPGAGPVAVCLDGSVEAERALPVARHWADTHASRLQLVRVEAPVAPAAATPAPILPEAVDPLSGAVSTALATPPAKEFADAAETYLDGQVNMLLRRGFAAERMVVTGRRRAPAIVDHLRNHECDIAVMTSPGRRGLDRVVHGSTTVAVARHAPCPVLTVCNGDDPAVIDLRR